MALNNQCGIFGSLSIDLSEDDILAAMKSIHGFIDITPADFNEIYGLAYRHAVDRLSQVVKAEDIMTSEVISVLPDTSLINTARQMAAANISGVPVISEDQTVLGIISEKDFLFKMGADDTGSFMSVIAECLSNRGCVAKPIQGKIAKDIMSTPVITASADTPISELSKILAENQINRIPVTTGDGKLIGIVSRGDIVDSYCARIF